MKNELTPEIISKAQNDDISSLKLILKTAEKSALSYLTYLTDDAREKDDITQEVLLKVTKNIKKLKKPEQFKIWLNKIILRQYYDHIRKNKKHNCSYDDISEINETKTLCDKKQPMDDCIANEITSVIKDSVSKLQEPYKLAILMREFQGLSYDEIAKLTNTSIGTVKSRIARARSRLKEYIKPYLE